MEEIEHMEDFKDIENNEALLLNKLNDLQKKSKRIFKC